jgi:thioredoxin-dependent peroxiredoxin
VTKLEAGLPAPDFDLPADGGGRVRLTDLRGRKVVLYFYPKDDTPTCTVEAIAFNGLRKKFAAADTELIGFSADSPKRHDRFKKKYDLDFRLVSDETREVLEGYGLWVEKKLYGRKYMGIERTTLLIDREGKIARVWPKVSVNGHAEEVLEAAKAL